MGAILPQMGGYNKKTGIFSLTPAKARVWCRRPGAARERNILEYSANLLREAHLGVLPVRGNYLEVKATPGQIWEALSGQPSDPKRESLHLHPILSDAVVRVWK
jgi:hypothetical protein